MSRRIAVITAIYDDYDMLKPPLEQEGVDVDWVCVTDRDRDPSGWRLVVEPRPFMHPNLAAKRPKMLPWDYTSADYSIWLDASFAVISAQFAGDLIDAIESGHPLLQFHHPWRNCIYTEAAATKGLAKYEGHPVDRLMGEYRSWGHPEAWGLWATGLIVRNHDVPEVRQLGERWLRTCHEWSFQDQLSEAPHLRVLGLRPENLAGSHLSNRWVDYQGSARH